MEQMTQLTSICERACQIIQKKLEEKQIEEEQAAKAQNRKLPVCYDDDDDEEESNSLKDNIISELPPCSAITPSEPIDSLSMGDEHLDTILAMESDEFIKSYVETLVPNPSESEGKNGCDVPFYFTTFSNILFDTDYDFESVDDQSLHNEDVSKKIFSNPLFEEEIISIKKNQHHFNAESDLVESMLNRDSSIISSSSKIDSLLDEFAGELTLLKSIPPEIDKTECHPENEIRLSQRLFLLHLAGSQPMLKSSYKAEASVIISIPPLVGGVADVVVEIKGTGNVEDKILVPKLPKNCARCARCGHPVNGSYCQGCTLLREKLEEDLVTYFQNFQNISQSFDGSTNVVNAPREPFVFKQDHGVNPPHIDECCCECGDALDGIFCQQCTCKSCGKGAHIVPFINSEPGYSQDFNFLQDIHDFQQQYFCCDQCRGPHETFQCQQVIFYEPCCENYGGPHETFHCQPPQYTVDYPIFNAHNDLLNSQNELSIAQNKLMEQMTQLTSMCELACQIVQKKQEEKRIEEEQAASARYWKIPACCDDDDDDNSAITPVLSTEEPVDSLSMGDEHLDTIPAIESDEVIKSSVEDLVPIPSEFEVILDTMYDMHLVNNPTPLEAKDHCEIVTKSNDDISSSDDDSLYNENI
nr:hypothetical protein [Tanacetum cinerariifolium]